MMIKTYMHKKNFDTNQQYIKATDKINNISVLASLSRFKNI